MSVLQKLECPILDGQTLSFKSPGVMVSTDVKQSETK